MKINNPVRRNMAKISSLSSGRIFALNNAKACYGMVTHNTFKEKDPNPCADGTERVMAVNMENGAIFRVNPEEIVEVCEYARMIDEKCRIEDLSPGDVCEVEENGKTELLMIVGSPHADLESPESARTAVSITAVCLRNGVLLSYMKSTAVRKLPDMVLYPYDQF